MCSWVGPGAVNLNERFIRLSPDLYIYHRDSFLPGPPTQKILAPSHPGRLREGKLHPCHCPLKGGHPALIPEVEFSSP